MRRLSITILFLGLLLIELFGFVLPQLGGSRRPSLRATLFVIEQGNSIEVLSEDEGNALFEGSGPYPDFEVHLSAWLRPGPIEILFEFNEQRSFDTPRISETSTHQQFEQNDLKRQQIESAVIQYARADPVLSRYNPGGNPVTRFTPWRAVLSIAFWAMACLVPALLTLFVVLIVALPGQIAQERAQHRVNLGLCVHCAYDCNKINAPICPECGRNYAMPESA